MSTQTIERTTLSNLVYNEPYARKVLPFIKPEYFANRHERVVFEEINKFVEKYGNQPTKEALSIELDNRKDLNEDEFKSVLDIVQTLSNAEVDMQWLVDTTEKFCKDKAVYNAILSGIQIIEGKDKQHTAEAIPNILSDALAVAFDQNVGHDYVENGEERYEFYHKKEEKLEFDLDYFNKITKGGLPQKTLNIAIAGTGVGKSLFMCHMAASTLMQGKNVLYITLEMAEERIAERIDANLMNITMDDLHELPKKMFTDRLSKIQTKTNGKLIIKEYPTASAHSGHFRSLMKELALKKSFKPDIIFIDYLIYVPHQDLRGMQMLDHTFTSKQLPRNLEGLQWNIMFLLCQRHKLLEGGMQTATLGWKIRQNLLVCLLRLTSCLLSYQRKIWKVLTR